MLSIVRRRSLLCLTVVAALVASVLAVIVGPSSVGAAVPGNGSVFDCFGNTIYTVQRGANTNTAGSIYALDTGTFANTSVTATAVTTLPSTANQNALAIAKGGAKAAVVAQTGNNGSVPLYVYDAVAASWTTHTGFAGNAQNFVAGAIDPSRDIYYYATFNRDTAKATVYGYDLDTDTPINGTVATVTLPLATATAGNVNGDMAFDLAGNLYLVESLNTSAGVSVVKGQLPDTGAGATISSTQLKSYTVPDGQGWNGIAFDNFGRLYIEYTTGTDTILQRLNPNTGTVLDGPTKQGLPGTAVGVDLAACSLNPTLTVSTNVVGRSLSDDQFTSTITGGGITQGNTASTTGASTGVQAESAGPVIGVSGTKYTITQTSTTNRLGNYTVTYRCLDAAANNRVVASGTGPSFELTMPDPATGATGPYVTCTFTDTPTPAALTTTKTLTRVNGTAADAATKVTAGDVLTYSITTVNTGGRSSTTQLGDTVPANTTYSGSGEGWSCASGAAAGTSCTQSVVVGPNGVSAATVTKTFTVTVGTLPTGTTSVRNVATSTDATCTNCTVTNQTAPVLDTTLQIVSVNGAAATPSTVVNTGDVVVYRSTTTNTGGSAGSTTLSNPVPSRTTYDGTGQGWNCANGSAAGTACTQSVTVASGGSVSVDYTVSITSVSGVAAITDTVASSGGTCSSCRVSNPTPAQLSTSLVVSTVNGTAATATTQVKAGDVVGYTVTVVNGGGTDGSTLVTNAVADNTTYRGTTGETWTCPAGSAAGSLCAQDVAVPASTTVTRTYTVQLVDPLPSGTTKIDDAITSSVGSCPACAVSNPTVAILDTTLTLATVNGAAATAGTTVKAGDKLVYRVATSNTGGSTGTTTLRETVPANTTFSGIAAQGWSCAAGSPAGTVCTHDSSITAGATVGYFFAVTLDKPLADGASTIVDTVTTSAGTCSSCTASNAVVPTFDTVVVIDTVNGQPATAGTPLAQGDEVGYRIRVTNADGPGGDVTITNVVPANTTFTGSGWSCPAGSAAGTNCTRTVRVSPGTPVDVAFPVTVGALPAGVRTVDESATVSAGTCSACTVSNPTVAQLVTTLTVVSVNGAAATASTPVAAGDVVVYRVATENVGGSTGTTTIGNVVPAGSTYIGTGEGWTCDTANTSCTQDVTLAAGAGATREATVTIGVQPAGTKTVTDTASSTVGTCAPCTATNPTVAALTTTVVIVSVNGQAATPGTALQPGDVVVYATTVSNSGGSTGSTTIGDTVPANTTYTGTGQGWSCATGSAAGTTCTQVVTVPSGGDVTTNYTVTVDRPLPANTTTIDNTVTTTDGACTGCTASNPTVAVVATTLALSTVNGAPATSGTAIASGDVLGYAVTVTNTGGSPAEVTLGQTVPDQTTYTGTGWTCTAAGACTRTVTVTPGNPVVVGFEVTAVAPFATGTTSIEDTVTADVGTCASCTVGNPTVAHLDTVLTLVTVNGKPYVAGTPVGSGDVLGYRATVTNTGGSAGGTTLRDTVPGNATYTGTDEGWSCATGSAAATSCTQDVTVPAGGSTSVDYTVTLDSPLPAGTTTVGNTAQSSNGSCSACTVTTATVGKLDTVLTLAQVNGAPADNDTQIAPDATLHYTVTLTNSGGTSVTTTLTQTVPAHASYSGVGEGWTCADGTCTREVTVAPAATTTLDFTVLADPSFPAGVTTITDTVDSSVGSCLACTVANPTVARLDTTLVIATVNGKPYVDGTALAPGDVVGYRLEVTNTGGSSGSTTLGETVPANTTYTGTDEGWSCATGSAPGTACTQPVTVGAGATTTVTYTVTVASPLPSGTTSVGDTATTTAGTCSACTATAPVVGALDTVLQVVTVNGDPATAATQVQPGDEIGYRVTVTNTGGAAATTTITQTVPAHTTYTGTGEGWTCAGTSAGSTCTHEVTAGAGDSATVTFTVTVGDLPADVTTVDDTITTSAGTCSACSVANPTVGTLSVSKRVTTVDGDPATDATPVAPGDVVTYTITAVNSGGSSATTTLTDTVPANATYTGTGQGWSCAGGSAAGTACTQTITVAASSHADVTFTMTVADDLADGTGTVANTVTSSAGACSACTATSPTVGALTTSKQLASVNGEPVTGDVHVRTGDVLGYAITVRNGGGTAATTTLTETVPAHTAHTGEREGWTCTDVTCTHDVAVPALQSAIVTFTVTVADLRGSDGGELVNVVASSAGDCSSCTVRTTTAHADVTVTKTANRRTVAVGERVTFTVRLRNAGPDEARAVTVADDPTGLRLVTASAATGRFATGTWTVPALAAGASTTLTATYLVTGTGVRNVATVTGRLEFDPTRARDVASIGVDEAVVVGPDAGRPGVTAVTGFDSGTVLEWGLLLLILGAGLLLAVRRRRA